MDMDICYGFMTMISANFTKQVDGTTDSSKIISVYEVRVEKGCGKKSKFMSHVENGKLFAKYGWTMYDWSI